MLPTKITSDKNSGVLIVMAAANGVTVSTGGGRAGAELLKSRPLLLLYHENLVALINSGSCSSKLGTTTVAGWTHGREAFLECRKSKKQLLSALDIATVSTESGKRRRGLSSNRRTRQRQTTKTRECTCQ
jgi:hypothetical protein